LIQSHLTMMEQGHKIMPDPTLSAEMETIKANVSEAVKNSIQSMDFEIR
jgi:hypothetical protein